MVSTQASFDDLLQFRVLDGMEDWARVIGKDNRVIYANKAMIDALGADLIGKPCHYGMGKNEPCKFCIAQRSLTTGEVVRKEDVYFNRHYTVKSSPIRNSEGEVFAAVEVYSDVTRERRLEQILMERNKLMRRDVAFARTLQQKLLPEPLVSDQLDFSYVYQPSQMLSGDFMDILPFDDGSVGMYIADVVGHGISASMMTIFVYHVVREVFEETRNPDELLAAVQRRYCDLNLAPDQYFSLLVARYDPPTRTFSFSNAGHNCAPIIKRKHGPVEAMELRGYPITSIQRGLTFDAIETELNLGDRVLFYTDGCVELTDMADVPLGTDGLLNLYREYGHEPLTEFYYRVIDYGWGEQLDDYAMLQMIVKE